MVARRLPDLIRIESVQRIHSGYFDWKAVSDSLASANRLEEGSWEGDSKRFEGFCLGAPRRKSWLLQQSWLESKENSILVVRQHNGQQRSGRLPVGTDLEVCFYLGCYEISL